MVPYPRVHFMTPSMGPFISDDEAYKSNSSVSEIAKALFSNDTFLLSADKATGRSFAANMVLQGAVS